MMMIVSVLLIFAACPEETSNAGSEEGGKQDTMSVSIAGW